MGKLYKGTQEICPIVNVGINPSGSINITENGTHDVTNYSSASVNVQSVHEPSYTADYETMVEKIDNVKKDGYSSDKALQQGWVIYSNNTVTHLFGMVLGDDTSSIYIRTMPTYQGWVYSLKIPESASITEVSTDIRRIDFGNEKWVCLGTGNINVQQMRRCANIEGGSWTNNYNIAKIICMYLPTITNSSGWETTVFNLASLPYAKIIKVPDNISLKALTLSDGTLLKFITQLDNCDEICKKITGYTDTDGYLLPCTKASVKNVTFGLSSIILKKCPITFDFSSDTGTGTFNICVFNGYSGDMIYLDYDFKIKLPSTYSTVELCNYNASIPFSQESLEYIANKAPNVSNVTLSIGPYLDKWLSITTVGQSIKSTLTNKGWTVTT